MGTLIINIQLLSGSFSTFLSLLNCSLWCQYSAVTTRGFLTPSLAVLRLTLYICCWNPSLLLLNLQCLGWNVYLLSDVFLTCCAGDLVQSFKLWISFSLPPSFCLCLSFSRLKFSSRQLSFEAFNFEAFSPVPTLQNLTCLTPSLIFILCPVSRGLDAVVYDDTHSLPHSSQRVFLSLCLPIGTVRGSLSSWIRAGCPSRQRRQKDNARYLWWVQNMTLELLGAK